MTFLATSVVLEVILLIVAYVAYVAYRVLVREVPIGMGFEIEVKLLPPSIRVKRSKDRD
jgi:hypothetical protein